MNDPINSQPLVRPATNWALYKTTEQHQRDKRREKYFLELDNRAAQVFAASQVERAMKSAASVVQRQAGDQG